MIYAFGDIHGQNYMLQAALRHLEDNLLQPEDTVVFLGDYIDRGEDTRGVFDTLRAFKERHSNTIFLRGNHEELFMYAYEDEDDEDSWLLNGGVDTLASYGSEWITSWRELIPQNDLEFIADTEIEYITDHYHFVHAGLPPDSEAIEFPARRDPRLWIRSEFIDSHHDFGRIVVFGHTPQRSMRPLVMRNKIGIDTAAVFGGRLSVAGFDDSETDEEIRSFMLFQVDKHGEIVGASANKAPDSEPPRRRAKQRTKKKV